MARWQAAQAALSAAGAAGIDRLISAIESMARTFLCIIACLGTAAAADPPAQYIGAQACGECHAAEFEQQSRSMHARTLAPSSSSQPGDWAFGAGRQAITFVQREDAEHYRELGQ